MEPTPSLLDALWYHQQMRRDERAQIAGAIMSRFMIFVWMEAFAQKWYLKCGDNKVHRIELTDWRDHAFWCAWQKGLLTVSWGS